MLDFVAETALNHEMELMISNAERQIVLISPYIKLHERIKSALKQHINSDYIQLIVVFGKNEGNLEESIKQEELEFFKQFLNLEIRYEKRLHAKFYSNEKTAIITSMNLYDFSHNNNIEVGIVVRNTILGNIAGSIKSNITGGDSLEDKISSYFGRIVDQSELIFKKVPKYSSVYLGLSKKYTESIVEVNELDKYFKVSSNRMSTGTSTRNQSSGGYASQSTSINLKDYGFCIRTGKKIPFNIEKPLSYESYQIWSEFENENYRESYCHLTGEPSNGNTSKANPILGKNIELAKKLFNV